MQSVGKVLVFSNMSSPAVGAKTTQYRFSVLKPDLTVFGFEEVYKYDETRYIDISQLLL